MSYYLLAFEKEKAPKTRKEFLAWFEQQAEWSEDHDYQTIGVASAALQNWFMQMKDTFPPLNGPYSPDMEEMDEQQEERLTDYCIGRDVIYAAFAWSVAEEAYELAWKLAQEHSVGLFDVNEEGADILLPDGTKLP